MEILDFCAATDWECWLHTRHHDQSEAWLRIAKRHAGLATITIAEALDVALCFGWIDGQRKAYDDLSFLQRFSRRRAKSSWSKLNTHRVDALTAAGRMRPPGLAEVAAAKADGRWRAAYEPQRTATPPADLAAALAGNTHANAAFQRLSRTARYALILPVLRSHTPDARGKALARAITQLTAPK